MHRAIFIPRKQQLVMLIMLLCAWLPIASIVSFSHSPILTQQVEQQRHSELAVDLDEHGHSHHDGDVAEQATGHVHGHANFDHDHDLSQILLETKTSIHLPQIAWQQQQHAADYPAPSYRLERPPRLKAIA
ncbi:hypothetical protein K4H28_13435 [Deefgea tanakiae]|uniref:Uncharacterized protein n=1 Tax=Deefgea tanakiae TaxID=2865840 RepID=A0ABX8Z3W4_9NEIS|nr:hypothetical protein [Deefgea tanakiae]QZA77274.1 hypothetical protein K4H28_13435 [Deefgea tanakiae]